MTDPRVQALCDEFGWELVGKHVAPGPGQTRAHATLRKCIDINPERARITCQTLNESANNKGSLEREVIGAVFDLVGACRHYYDADPEKWFAVFDLCPIESILGMARDLRGFVPMRAAVAGLIYERIYRAYGPLSTQPDLLDDRRRAT